MLTRLAARFGSGAEPSEICFDCAVETKAADNTSRALSFGLADMATRLNLDIRRWCAY